MIFQFLRNNKEYFGIAICILVFIVVVSASLLQSQQLPCYSQLTTPQDSSTWEIFPPNPAAEIIWQKSEDRPRSDAFTGIANSDIAVSAQHVVYDWIPHEPACGIEGGSLLFAFDVQNGNEDWRFGGYTLSNFGRITPTNDGYILVSGAGGSVTRLDFNGQFIWQNNTFPSRSLGNVFVDQQELYLLSYSRVYHLTTSRGTGGIIETLEIPDVVGYFGDIGLVRRDENHMNVIDGKTHAPLHTIQLVDTRGMNLAWSSPQWTFANLYGDTLLLTNSSNAPTRIDAYNVETGALLWTLSENFYSFPVAQNNFLITYGENGLGIYDLERGELVNRVTLRRTVNGNVDTSPTSHVFIAGYDDVVAIYFRDTWELVTLRITSSEFSIDN